MSIENWPSQMDNKMKPNKVKYENEAGGGIISFYKSKRKKLVHFFSKPMNLYVVYTLTINIFLLVILAFFIHFMYFGTSNVSNEQFSRKSQIRPNFTKSLKSQVVFSKLKTSKEAKCLKFGLEKTKLTTMDTSCNHDYILK